MTGITIKKIIVNRAEGPNNLIGMREFSGSYCAMKANEYLIEISKTAPMHGGYDKTDTEIHLSNGQCLGFRHDIEYGNIDGTILHHGVIFYKYQIEKNPHGLRINEIEQMEKRMRLLINLRNQYEKPRP